MLQRGELNYGHSVFITERDSYFIQNDFTFMENQVLTIGYDYYEDSVDGCNYDVATDSCTPYRNANTGEIVESRDNDAFFIQQQLNFDRHQWVIGLREDDNEQYGSHTTGNLSWGFDVSSTLRVTAGYASGFKAPTFNDLYWPDPYGPGNPDLDVEESDNYEIGLRGRHFDANWSVNVFHNDLEDLIQWQPIDPSDIYSAWSPVNVAEVEIDGIELEASTELAGWLVNANAQYIKAEDQQTGNDLLRRPRQHLNVDVDRNFGKWDVGLNWKLQGSRYNDQANLNKLGGYGLIGLRGGYQLVPAWRLQASVENLV